jgi:histidine triad (HIT) family protein
VTGRPPAADCIFCRILAGDSPASVVYRDDLIAAFMDIQPVNPGHLLVVPVRHAPYLAELTPEEAGAMARFAQRAAAALRASTLRCEGINLFLADGEAAMQEVFHVHLHVLPRFGGDGFGLRFPPEYRTRRMERGELDRQAAQLGALLPPA